MSLGLTKYEISVMQPLYSNFYTLIASLYIKTFYSLSQNYFDQMYLTIWWRFFFLCHYLQFLFCKYLLVIPVFIIIYCSHISKQKMMYYAVCNIVLMMYLAVGVKFIIAIIFNYYNILWFAYKRTINAVDLSRSIIVCCSN